MTGAATMLQFFKGWRRKLGTVLLVIATALMGGWIRSRYVADEFKIPANDPSTFQLLASEYSGVLWLTGEDPSGMSRLRQFYETDSIIPNNKLEIGQIEWRYESLGFQFGRSREAYGIVISYCFIPYWSLVMPTTLLAAFLLIRRPRIRKESAKPH